MKAIVQGLMAYFQLLWGIKTMSVPVGASLLAMTA